MIRIVEVAGNDAGDFLSRVTAGTVFPTQVGQGRPGLLLNGQSRVLAQFDLLRISDQMYALAAPEPCAKLLAESLEALHFSENLVIELTDQRRYLASDPGAGLREAPFRFSADLEWPSAVPGFRFIKESEKACAFGFDFARIPALVPWPASEWVSGETPALEAGMLPWIDREKGCYPGQEVVELSLNVGHPARVLVAVEGDAPWEGVTVTSSAQENGVWRAIVRLPWAKRDIFPPGISRIAAHW